MRPTTFVIQDFQSLEDVRFELGVRPSGGGLTTVEGPSSTGKSAVVRAIRLLYENSSFPAVRAGATRAVVSVTAEDGSVVEVSRGPSHSVYRHTSPEGIEEKFPKAGRSVPDDIAQKLNLAEGVHFASQFDPPYLLAESGSKVSSVIGAFTHAEEMQSAAREGNRRRLKSEQEKQIRIEDMKSVAQKLKELDPDRLLVEREALEQTKVGLARAEDIASRMGSLTKALGDLEKLDQAKENFAEVLSRPVPEDMLAQAMSLRSQIVSLAELLKAAMAVQNASLALAQAEESLAGAEADLKAVEAEIEVCPTCGRPM